MLNQVILMGRIVEIFDDNFVIQHADSPHFFKIYGVEEETIAQLLLNNLVGVRGHLEATKDCDGKIVLDTLTILDARGKSNGE